LVAPQFPLVVDMSFFTKGARITDLVWTTTGVNAPDYSLDKYDEAVLLTDLSSTLRQSSNEIYKISNYINGWNAGATSTKQIRGAATGQAWSATAFDRMWSDYDLSTMAAYLEGMLSVSPQQLVFNTVLGTDTDLGLQTLTLEVALQVFDHGRIQAEIIDLVSQLQAEHTWVEKTHIPIEYSFPVLDSDGKGAEYLGFRLRRYCIIPESLGAGLEAGLIRGCQPHGMVAFSDSCTVQCSDGWESNGGIGSFGCHQTLSGPNLVCTHPPAAPSTDVPSRCPPSATEEWCLPPHSHVSQPWPPPGWTPHGDIGWHYQGKTGWRLEAGGSSVIGGDPRGWRPNLDAAHERSVHALGEHGGAARRRRRV